ncbi:MAG: hypothetical protein ACRDA3_00835 [Peptostreptococcaceae bacterium]
MENMDLNLYVKENNTYINIPHQILNKGNQSVSDYIKIYTDIENLKELINKYLFDKSSKITPLDILNKIMKIKSLESINEILPFLEVDIDSIEERLINVCSALGVDLEKLYKMRDDLANSYISTEHCLDDIISENYVNEIVAYIKSEDMYSLNARSTYGTMSKDYDLKNIDDISDLNDTEINGRYSPILVIHKPAKYLRGTYILDNTAYVYIKRQPLDALIKQEGLETKGTDSMGAILYKKLDHQLTNENLQELLAEIYVYAKKNNINFENIKQSDIGANKVWMTADKLKKEFKELRYYNKNLSQKLKEIYDTTGSYYTQIGGKYIFNSREFLHNYKSYKDKNING